MKAIILAAGYATRLYPLTKDKPKALLEIGGRPLLNYLMDKIAKIDEVDKVVVVTNEKFYEAFSLWADDLNFSKEIEVVNDHTTDNDNRLGAIGDLRYAIEKTSIDDDILVFASDNLFEESLEGFVANALNNPDGSTIGIYDIKDPSIGANRYGIIEIDDSNKITRIEEKPSQPKSTYVSMGVYYFRKETLAMMQKYVNSPEKKDAPGHFVTWLMNRRPVFTSLFKGKWYDIGSLDQLEEANKNYQAV